MSSTIQEQLAQAEPIAKMGRAELARLADGRVAWVLPASDGELAKQLFSASKRGLFGFSSLDAIEDGRHVLVRQARERLAEAKPVAMPWRDAITIVRSLLRAQSELESRSLASLPLSTSDVTIDPPTLLATSTLARMLGGEHSSKRASPRWWSPEVIDGAPWDHLASRYFLGLVAYRLIAGDLPKIGNGVRAEIEARAQWGVPPFSDDISRTLAPGVESAVLAWLTPVRDQRAHATDMIATCDELLGAAARPVATRKSAPATARPNKPAHARSTSSPRASLGRRMWAWPLVAGALTLTLSFALRPDEESHARPAIKAVRMNGTAAQDCAPCHQREVDEWQRSVMSQASRSPLFGALESEVEEQVGRDDRCPNGAGFLRTVPQSADVCVDERTSITKTGAGGEGWCVNCHVPGANVTKVSATWSAFGDPRGRAPLRDMLPSQAQEGISCVSCHTTVGPVDTHARARGYEGNPTWTSTSTGRVFFARPEDDFGTPGIANSGYRLDSALLSPRTPRGNDLAPHASPSAATTSYMKSSEMCGACHDVRLFGTDALAATGPSSGEHMKRLRNAYSEWRTWSDDEARAGRTAPSCQGCHMSRYPGVCVPAKAGSTGDPDCPTGTRFEARAPSDAAADRTHYFTSVDLPLAREYPDAFLSERSLDAWGTPVGLRARRNILLKRTFKFGLGEARFSGQRLAIPVELENVGAGHRVPAGFSQEREIWVELRVEDSEHRVVYEVGRVDRDDEDLHDKSFERINVSGSRDDRLGRPEGVFGATVADGPDVPQWSPPPALGGSSFRGLGLLNLQNGFLRCVRCIGTIDERGECKPNQDQHGARSERFVDGVYDIDTGACFSNLSGQNALFETYFPVGALDADRGIAKAPDAIIDTRSAPPGVPLDYTYDLDVGAHKPPFTVRARLRFRAFPPYLVRAFADYESIQAARGLRPSGAQVTSEMLSRVEIVDLATSETIVR